MKKHLPNLFTLARVAMIPLILAAYLVWPQIIWLAPLLFTLAAITDLLDGYFARKLNLVTNLGKFLDPIADKLLNMAALVLLAAQMRSLFLTITVIVILAREFFVTGLRMLAAQQGLVIAADWFGKIKTVVQDITIVILFLNNFPFSLLGIPMDTFLLLLSLVLTVLSGINYFVKNKAVLRA